MKYLYKGKAYKSQEEVAKAYVNSYKNNLDWALTKLEEDKPWPEDFILPPMEEWLNNEENFYKVVLNYAIALFDKCAEYGDDYEECYNCGVTIFSE